jgi:hypothetical protein
MPDLSTEADFSRLRVLDLFRVSDRAGAGWLSPAWWDAVRDDPTLAKARITVDLVFGQDTVVRMSTTPFKVTSATTGRDVTYLPCLQEEPEVSWSYTVGSGAADVQSATVEVAIQLVQPARIVGARRMLAGYGEVCLQIPGGDYDQRIVLLRGEMTGGVAFGTDDETLEVELSDPKITADLIVPPWVAGTDRHADLPEDWSGERYPLIFNGGTSVECIRITTATGWPSGSSPSFLVGYGHGLTVGTVYVNGVEKLSGSADYPWTEVEAVDLLGTPYTELAFTAVATAWEENDSVNATVTTTESLHLVQIIQRLVEQFSVIGSRGSHAALFGRARGLLPDLRPLVVINASNAADEGGILTFVEGTLLASYPMVSMVWQNGKYGPIVTDWRAIPTADLTAEEYPLINRVSAIQESAKEDLFNYFTVRYAYDPLTETYNGVVTRDPGNDTTCRLSRDSVGARAYATLESPLIQTAAEANYVIDWLVAHFAVPSYYVEWEAHPWVFLFLTRGQTLWFTDSEFTWTAERATVETVEYQHGKAVLGLRVWPGRKRLATLRA